MATTQTLIASWHPTYAYFHNPYAWGAFETDLDRFARAIHGRLDVVPDKRHMVFHPTYKDVRRLAKHCLRSGDPFVLDIETKPEAGDEEGFTGKDALRCQLRLVGLGCSSWGLSHYWRNDGRRVEREIKYWLEHPKLQKVLQNGEYFDQRVMARYDIDVHPVFDIREQRRALSATSPLRLDYQVSLATDFPSWKADHSNKDEKGYVWWTNDIDEEKDYNIKDTIGTARCKLKWDKEPEWPSERVQKLYAHQHRLAQIAAQMNTTGIKIDKVQRYFMAYCLKQKFVEETEKLEKLVAIPDWTSSPDNMRALIYKKHATGKKAHLGRFNLEDPYDPDMYVDPKEMTTIGVDETQLTMLLVDGNTPEELKEIINQYWEVQGTWKQRSTFIASKKVSQTIDQNYRMHPDFNSCGTDTGRFTGPIMITPKPLRSMYVADRNCKLIGADYRQMELRVMYAVTRDEALGDGIRKGNVYVEEAKDYFNLPKHFTKVPDGEAFDPLKHIKPSMYKVTKNTRLAAQYGSGKKKFYHQLMGMDRTTKYDDAMRVRDAFLVRNHRTVEWWDEETERVILTGYSASRIMDRRRVYPRLPDRPEIANYPIQSTAADVKNIALIAVADAIERYHMKSRIIIDLHDAIYVNAPNGEVKAMTGLLEECMTQTFEIQGVKYNFPVDIGVHERWSDFS